MSKAFKRVEYFLAHPSLLGLSLSRIFRKVQKVGFDGIEVMLTKSIIRNPYRCIHLAKQYNLGITFHQPWEGDYSIFNRVLKFLHVLPDNFDKISNIVPNIIRQYPIVIQSWRINEIEENNNYMLQPIFPYDNISSKAPFEEVMERIKKEDIKLAFDVFYYLEGYFHGLEKVPRDRDKLFDILKKGWDELRENIVEIHFYDFFPGKGLLGKNLLPGTGFLPLDQFLECIRKDDWKGRFVFELSPLQLYPSLKPEGNLKKALDFTKEILS